MRALGNFREDAVELLHLSRTADHGSEALREPKPLAQLARRRIRQVSGGGTIEHRRKLIDCKGLGQIVCRTRAHRFDSHIHRG